ncbi:conserved hypothetical protein [Culex quinquefasciatus]|uniref:Uncharacterized protein n=1 Tax=Culex quinquefasciatus TaxID=7176 RepID=B0WJ71_CULQU|nr:conserved hypothetical protein [Culex quinquefasciatus]|eukprot:XP_001848755.1 conserved hypothetical protein [Culex quinquefasciatus]
MHILSAEEPKCPIYLYPPVAAKITKCGHVYVPNSQRRHLRAGSAKCRVEAVPLVRDRRLMRRKKTSMALALASEDAVGGPPTTTFRNNQIVVDGMDCLENIFVQQALEQINEHREEVACQKIAEPLSELAAPIVQQAGSVTESPEQPPMPTTDIATSTVQSLQCATSGCFYFYQASDGQPLFLHSMKTRMLQAMYEGLGKGPLNITGKIVQKDICSMSEDLRKRLGPPKFRSVPTSISLPCVESYNFSMEPILETCYGTYLHFPIHRLALVLVVAVHIKSTSSRWPFLGTTSSTNAFGPLATPPAPKLPQVTGSKVSGAPLAERRRISGMISAVDADEELLESARSPEFHNDLSFAIEVALVSGRPPEDH